MGGELRDAPQIIAPTFGKIGSSRTRAAIEDRTVVFGMLVLNSESEALACMAHKSSEICERCRLRQRNTPATPDPSAAFLERRF